MIDIKEFTEYLIKTGKSPDEAAAKVAKMIEVIKKRKGDNVPDEDVMKLLKQGFARAASSKSDGDRIDGVVVGYTPMWDKNRKYTENIINKYNDSKTREEVVAAGAVKFEKDIAGRDKMMVIDVREYIDPGRKYKNYNFGKEAKPKFERTVYVIAPDGVLHEFKGKVDVKFGGLYHINYKAFGNRGTKYIVSIQQYKTLNAEEIWDKLSAFAEIDPIAQTLDAVSGADPYMLFLTTGFISKKGLNQKVNKYWVSLNGVAPDQFGFGQSANEEVAAVIEEAFIGAEVMAIVRTRPTYVDKEGKVRSSFDIIGLAVAPDAQQNNEILDDVDIVIQE